MNTYQQWSDAAKMRAPVVLADGRTATLICAYQWRRTCKVLVHARYAFVRVQDIKLIWASQQWIAFEPWPCEEQPSWLDASMTTPQRSTLVLHQVTLHPAMIPHPAPSIPDLRA